MYSCNVFQKEQFAVARVCTMTWYHLPFPRLYFPTYSPHEKPNSIAYPIFKLPMQLNLLPYCQSMQWNSNSLMINAIMKLPALLKDCCCENWLADFVNRFHYSLTLIPYIPSFPPSCKFLLSFPLVIKTHIFLIKYWFANDERWDGMFDIVWLFPSKFPIFCIYFPFPYINSFP